MFLRRIRLIILGFSLSLLIPGMVRSQECFATLDFDGDGLIGIGDLILFSERLSLLANFPTEAYKADVNGDCVIDQSDFDHILFCATTNLPGVCGTGSFSVCCAPEIRWPPPCCVANTGNIDNDPDDITDISDLTVLIDHLFINFPSLACREEANIDGDPAGLVDISDLTVLIDHLFINFPPTAPCQ